MKSISIHTVSIRSLAVLALLGMSLFSLGCGNDEDIENCTAPAGSKITVTEPGTLTLADDATVDITAVVTYPDGTVMPNACLTISGTFAYPRNAAGTTWHYQFYYYPRGSENPNNLAVDNGFTAQTDDFGQYTFSATISFVAGAFDDTIIVRSGANVGSAGFGMQ